MASLEGKQWYRFAGATAEQMDELRSIVPVDLPLSYLRLVSFSNGGEGPLSVQPYNLCLDSVEEVIQRIRTRNYGQEDFDGFVIFGGSGGGEYLAFDTRGPKPWPIVCMDMVAGSRSARSIAADFDEFIALIGTSQVVSGV